MSEPNYGGYDAARLRLICERITAGHEMHGDAWQVLPTAVLRLLDHIATLEAENATIKTLRDADPELSRAAALLRAVEGLEAACERENRLGSALLDDPFVAIALHWGKVKQGPLFDALIALAAQIGDRDAE